MSRTVRKRTDSGRGPHNEAEVIEGVIKDCLRRPNKRVRNRKPKAVYKAEHEKAGVAFQAEWARLMKVQTLEGLETRDYYRLHNDAPHWLRYKHYVRKFVYTEVEKVLEDEIVVAIAKFKKHTRDGHWWDSRGQGYRTSCARPTRNKNNKLCRDIMRDAEYDQKPYPSHFEEKHRIWDWR